MTTSRRLVSNTLVVVIGGAAQRLLHFVTTIVLARGLGEEEFGTYAFVVAYMFIFGFIVDLGFERVITREISRQPERAGELIGTGFVIRGVLSLLAATVAVVVAWLLNLPALTQLCILLTAIGLPLSIEILVRGFFQSRFEMHYTYLLTLPGQIVFVASAAVVISLGGRLPAVFVSALITGVLTVALILWVALPKMAVVWRPDPILLRYLWRESWELGAVILLFLISMRIDQVLLYWLRGTADVGQYAVAVKVTEALSLIPESVMVTLFPLLAATERSAPERFQQIYRVTVRYLIALVLPIALLLTLERAQIIRVLYGAAYAEGATALALLAWWMFFSFTGAVYINLMVVNRQQRVMAVVSAAAVALNLLLNLLWIPRWGATGAAAATLVSGASSFVLFSVVPQTQAILRVCCREAIRPLIAIAATAVGVRLLMTPSAQAVAVVPLYVVLLVTLGGVDRHDWAWVGEVWHPTQPRR
ncbi:MAG: flippase [Deltaproteobacteria bacterium]|nr:flippase [Deltaproteobacteria bacterium]MBI3390799.1 flippase [Deltaproteobacteria bacterium]